MKNLSTLLARMIFRSFSSVVCVFACLLLLASPAVRAQDTAALTGVVTDATGAVISGATITLTNPSNGAKFVVTSDNKGSYRFADVPPGAGYKLTISRDGFSNVSFTNIPLGVAITRTQNAKLVAGSTETVEVSAGNSQVTLNTTDATIGNNIDVEQLNSLPIQDRTNGISTLFTQQPGVDINQGAVAGARIDQSSVTIDGMDVNDIAAGGAFAIIAKAPVDSVDQFTGTVAGLVSSEGTGSGAQFQLVTRSGTNRFHGNINEYHRDTSTAANTWFNNLTGLGRTPLIRNQFGGSIGGPIRRDKLFFFFDLADSRIIQSSTAEPTVPLASYRAGTLNYINTSSSSCGDSTRITSLTGPLPSCITNLSSAQVKALDPLGIGFNPSVLSFINSRYPLPNDISHGDGVNTAGFRFTYPTPNFDTTYVGRIDYQLTHTQKIFGRFTINRQNETNSAPEFPTDPLTHPFIDRSYSYVVSHIWTIGANKVNQFYYGDTITKYSFPDLYNPTGANQYSFTGLGGPYTNFDGQQRRVPIPVVRDDFNWKLGSHNLTMGGQFKFIKTHSNLISNFNNPEVGLTGTLANGLDSPSTCAGYTYCANRPADISQTTSGAATTDFDNLFTTGLGVIGDISTNYVYNNKGVALPAGSGESRAYRFYETEAYVGDTWKVTSNLTLSYGVRYQLYSVPYEANGNESVSSPIDFNTYIKDRIAQQSAGNITNTGLPIYSYVLGGKANNGPNLYAPSYKDFAPRFAFSYNPSWFPKLVVNGGAGIVYDRTVINAINFLQDQISYLFFNTQNNPYGAGATKNATGAYNSLLTDARLGPNLSYSASLNPAPSPITTPYTPYYDPVDGPYGLAEGATSFVISPKLKDPYSIALNFGVQQELPWHMVMKVNYAGRLGRRLLADADASQVLDVPDYTGKSTQTMAQAFAAMTVQKRAGATITKQPWFEDVLGPNALSNYGFPTGSSFVNAAAGTYVRRGDISDALYELALYGVLPTNIGIPAQFGTNAYLTNMGSSNYHGLLITLDKNVSQGLRFEFNYTWSHSIDNSSLSANNNSLFSNSGFICDVTQPRACRATSDFDVNQEISSNFSWALPFGRGKAFAGTAPLWLDEAIGGWTVSGLPSYRTGLAVSPTADAFLASYDNLDYAIFTGNKADLKSAHNTDHSKNVLYNFAGGAAGAAKVFNEFRGPIGIEYGQRNLVRGPHAFYFDAGLGKTFPVIKDKVNLQFRADAFNLSNHPVFGNPALDIVNNASQFGQITATTGGLNGSTYRVAQFSLRAEF